MSRALVLLVLLGCKGDPEPGWEDNFGVVPDRGETGCDHLVDSACLYPYPSRAFIDASGALDLPEAGLPRTATGGVFSPEGFRRFVGFGAATPVLFQLPGAVPANENLFDPSASLADDATVVLVDASTGERIPHWVESDFLSDGLEPPLFVVRPAVPLPRGTEIVVGVRGLTDGSGVVAPAPEGFAALRDREATAWVGVHERRAQFEDVVFPTLEALGWDRAELQLAWSFPTRESAASTARMLAVRDAVFDALPPGGPEYTIDRVIDCPGDPDCHPSIRTIVDGSVRVPSVVEPPDPLGVRRLRLDASGQPVVQGEEVWPFRLQIPHVAYDGPDPVPVLQYGHGFLGRGAESNNGWIREMADRTGVAILACDMQGMNENDALTWTTVMLQAGGRFPEIADLAMQGVSNQLVQQRLLKTTLADDPHPSLRRDDGRLAWDPDTMWYHGNSQGGSVGTVMMAMSTDVTRGNLGVPGSGYPFLLHRSSVFEPFGLLIGAAYPDTDAIARFLAVLGTGWDDFDPLTFAPHIHGDPLPGTPDHEVMLHVAKEDRQVHNEASFILGRAAGASIMVPTVRPVFGLPEQTYPASPGAAVVEVDFGIPDDPTPLDPPDGDPSQPNGGDTHGWLRRWEPAQDQMLHFFRTGELIDVCGGVACVVDGAP